MLAHRPPLRLTRSSHWRTAIPATLARSYAQPANPPPPPPPPQPQPQWKPKPVLATAQTLTLFSESPQALIIALRSTLQGMTNLAARIAPPTSPHSTTTPPSTHDHVLLYSLTKHLPQHHLAQAVDLLRGADTSQPTSDTPQPRIARVGLLSSPLPTSLIPPNALEPGAPPIASPTLYSASLTLLPGVNAVPFRSEIPGRAQIAVGRWPDRKPSWQQGTEQRADHLDHPPTADHPDDAAQPADWRDIWGRDNLTGALPPALEQLDAASVLSLLLFTDPSPQGLVEGLEQRFPHSSVVGLYAPPTPFETGRDHTLLLTLPSHDGAKAEDRVYKDGAVGVALVANLDAQGQKAEVGAKGIARPSVQTKFEGLVPFGPRREVTNASGNIITELAGQNAAQQFLRDIQTRSSSSSSASSSASVILSETDQRSIASTVKKEEMFYIGFFPSLSPSSSSSPSTEKGEGVEEEALMISPILSGHPSRGTLSVDTDVDLGPGQRGQQGSMKIYAQFFQHPPSVLEQGERGKVEAIEIPGPDPSVWTSPRFLFLSLDDSSSSPSSSSSSSSSSSRPEPNPTNGSEKENEKEKGRKHEVLALPNLFVAASEKGWIAGRGKREDGGGGKEGGSVRLKRDGSSIVECKVDRARVVLSLRGEEGRG